MLSDDRFIGDGGGTNQLTRSLSGKFFLSSSAILIRAENSSVLSRKRTLSGQRLMRFRVVVDPFSPSAKSPRTKNKYAVPPEPRPKPSN